MGLEDRDYHREWSYTDATAGWGSEFISPVVKWLIVANIAVFLGQIFVTRPMTFADWKADFDQYPPESRDRLLKEFNQDSQHAEEQDGPSSEAPRAVAPAEEQFSQEFIAKYLLAGERVSIVQEWLQLDTRLVLRGQIWRLVTYAFCHDRFGLWHILLNMLFLFWFGVSMESMYGQREFLLFYLVAAAVSGLANVGLNVWTGSLVPTVGASGAVMAVLMLYAIHYPRNTIRVFWFFPIEARWVVLFYVLWDLHPVLLSLAGDRQFTGVAHAAHLGGLAFGFVYWKFNLQLEGWLDKIPRPNLARAEGEDSVEPRRPRRAAERDFDTQVDEVLRKISQSGEASLTDADRRILARASQRYKERRG
ncbi:MAG: rhomboid family intramembrane serine protease [Pirellulaceae bacterium]|nr:rhomboid family intramembrane serine protease [Pirellulaceae bacterium]